MGNIFVIRVIISSLYHRCPAFDSRKASADAGDRRLDLFGRAHIDQQNVIFAIFNRLAQPCFELGTVPCCQATLKDRQLEPVPVSLHDFEHTSPAPLIGDVVCDDIEPFRVHPGFGGIRGILGLADNADSCADLQAEIATEGAPV